jgi:PD-(D/E)XK nuclease superfamily
MNEPKLVRLSASKLKMYQKCPRMYLARYTHGDSGLNIWGIIGSAAHKAIEKYYKEGTHIVPTFYQAVAQSIHPDMEGFENAQSTQTTIGKGLAGFDPTIYTPLEVDGKLQLEKYFRLPYPNKDNPICTLEGYIDMVTEEAVIDFKTGKDKPSKKAVENDLQFVIYYWAYEQLYGRAPKSIIYHRIRDNKQIIGKKFSRATLDELIHAFISDPMDYPMIPCENCTFFCGVKRVTH